MERLDDVQQFGRIAGFAEEIGCAPGAGLMFVLLVIGGTEDHDRHLFEMRFALEEIEDFETIDTRHFEIKEKEIWYRVGYAGDDEVIDCLLAILDVHKVVR